MFKNKKRKIMKQDYKINSVVKDYPASSIAEQFRTLMTNISFSNINGHINSLVITSANPSEGKSTVSSNLAIAYAKQGKNVLLVDGDMRKPTIHKSFNLSNQLGFSTYLSDNSTLDNSIVNSDINNLKIITSGPIPPNPSELLVNEKIQPILNKYKGQNDLVIFDVPPVNAMTESLILASNVDATLMVVPQGIAVKKDTKMAVDQLKKVNANLIGAVMNMVTDNNDNDYYYYY